MSPATLTARPSSMTGRVLPLLKASLGGLSPTYWVLWSGTLINRLGAFVLPFLQIFLTSERGLSVGDAGVLISLYGVGALLSNPIGGALTDRLGRKQTMLISFGLS